MFLNVSTNIYMQLPLDEALAVISEMGFRRAEIFANHLNKLCEDKKYLSYVVGTKRIDIYSVHGYLNDLTEPDFTSSYEDNYHDLFSATKTLGASVFVTHIGEGKFEEWNRIKENVFYHCQLLADMARRYDLIIGLENDWGGGGPLRTVSQFEEMMKAVSKENFGIALDGKHSMPQLQYHTKVQADGPEEFIGKLSKYIVNYHAIELDGPLPLGLGDWDVPGTGTGRLGKVVSMLKSSGYKGPITIELASDLIQKVLGVVAEILTKSGAEVSELSELLKDKHSFGKEMLNYSREYLLKFM